jgi:protoporphyrinogen/coproporphyrinogen III oxidase
VPALVVGAGISGLVCAYALRKAGIDAQVVEAAPNPGGVIRSRTRDGFLLELGPQSFSVTPAIRGLCRELGLEGEIVEAPPRAPRFVLVDGSLKQVPLSPPAFFVSGLLSARTKWRILRDVFGRTTPPATEESVAEFVRRKFSEELLDKLVGPFVSGIYAGDSERLSLRAAFPQLYEAEKDVGSIIRGTMRAAKAAKGPKERPALQSFREGNALLIQALAAKLGSALRCGAEVKSVSRLGTNSTDKSDPFSVMLNTRGQQSTIETQCLVIATPTISAAGLLQNVNAQFAELLDGIECAPVAIVSLGYRSADIGNNLDGFGFLVPRSAGLQTLGTVWNSSLFPQRAPEGQVLLTSFVGGATNPQAIALPTEELVALVHREIAPLLAIRQRPIFSNVEFYERAIPQYNLGHAERIEKLLTLREKHSNLWLAGNYLHGPAIGACVEQALQVAEEVGKCLKK